MIIWVTRLKKYILKTFDTCKSSDKTGFNFDRNTGKNIDKICQLKQGWMSWEYGFLKI